MKLAVTLFAGLLLSACQSGGVGDPCTPEWEYEPTFDGFDVREVYLESASFECESRVCLINHFQGRVSCPWGQTEADLSLPATAPERCRVPASTDPVTAAVAAWNVARPKSQAVYCSCRCAGPDSNAHYCTCPKGYACTELVPAIGDGSRALVGSYCIKADSAFREVDEGALTCTDTPEHAGCPEPPFVNP